MMSSPKSPLQAALDEMWVSIDSGASPNIRELCRRFTGATRKTLGKYRVEERRIARSRGCPRTLSPAHEELVRETVATCQAEAIPLTELEVLNFANELLYAEQGKRGLTSSWLRHFLKRDADTKLTIRSGNSISSQRVLAEDIGSISQFYDDLSCVIKRYNVNPASVYAADETSVTMMSAFERRFVGVEGMHMVSLNPVKRSSIRLSLHACIALDGAVVEPFLLAQGSSDEKPLFTPMPGFPVSAACTKKAYQTLESFFSWLNTTFLPFARSRRAEGDKIVLILDNCPSHMPTYDQVRRYLDSEGLVFVFLPANTTHRLMPLDVGVFGPFKAKLVAQYRARDIETPVGDTFVPMLHRAWSGAFTPDIIRSAFGKVGITVEGDRVVVDVSGILKSMVGQEKLKQLLCSTPSAAKAPLLDLPENIRNFASVKLIQVARLAKATPSFTIKRTKLMTGGVFDIRSLDDITELHRYNDDLATERNRQKAADLEASKAARVLAQTQKVQTQQDKLRQRLTGQKRKAAAQIVKEKAKYQRLKVRHAKSNSKTRNQPGHRSTTLAAVLPITSAAVSNPAPPRATAIAAPSVPAAAPQSTAKTRTRITRSTSAAPS